MIGSREQVDGGGRETMGRGIGGLTLGAISGAMGEQSYEQKLTDIYKRKIGNFDSYTTPIVDQLQEDSVSTDIYDRTVARAGLMGAKAKSISARVQGYSMGGILPSQKRAADKRRELGVATTSSAMITDGAVRNRENRIQSRNQLLGMAEQLESSGTASLSQALQQKQQRDAAYSSAKGGFMSQIGSLAGAGIGFMAGGPMGAMAGAGIGGGIGGAVG